MKEASQTVLILIEGLGSTEWQLKKPLLPTLSGIADAGSCVDLSLPSPGAGLANVVTAMTGAWPDQHEVIVLPGPGARFTVFKDAASRMMSVRSIWGLFDEQGKKSVAVGWPASLGSSMTGGSAVVDAGFGHPGMAADDARQLVEPSRFSERFSDCLMEPGEIDAPTLAVLVPQWERINQDVDSRLADVAGAVTWNVSRHAAFIEAIESPDWEFATLALNLPLELGRLEYPRGTAQDDVFVGLSNRGMVLLEAFLREIVERLPASSQVLVVGTPGIGNDAGSAVLIAAGAGIKKGATVTGGSLLDIAPTVWQLRGLSVEGVPGRVLREILAERGMEEMLERSWPYSPAVFPGREPWPASPDSDKRERNLLTAAREISLKVKVRSMMSRNAWLSALPLLELQLHRRPDDSEALMLLVECQYFSGLYAEALENAWESMDLALPEDPLPLLAVATLEAAHGRRQRSMELLREAEPLVAKRPEARFQQGRVLTHLRHWREARDVLLAVVREDDNHAAAHAMLARACLALKQWMDACNHALRATALQPHHAGAHEVLGAALIQMGLLEEGRAALIAALRSAPAWPRPLARLYNLSKQLRRPEDETAELLRRYRETSENARAASADYLRQLKVELEARRLAAEGVAGIQAQETASVDSMSIGIVIADTGVDLGRATSALSAMGMSLTASFDPAYWRSIAQTQGGEIDWSASTSSYHLMPASLVVQLPKRYQYTIVHIQAEVDEVVSKRLNLPPDLAKLSDDDIHATLQRERLALTHTLGLAQHVQVFPVVEKELVRVDFHMDEALRKFIESK